MGVVSALAIIAIVVGSVFGYTTGCGVTYAIGHQRGWKPNENFEQFLAIAIWPLFLPGLLAAMGTRALLTRGARKQLPEARTVQR